MLSVTPFTIKDPGEKRALFYKSNFMQTIFWAELKEEYGFKALYFVIETGDVEEGLVVLIRYIGAGLSIAYIPHGPSEAFLDLVDLKELSKELKKYLSRSIILIRYDLLLKKGCKEIVGLRKSVVDIQVPDTTILNITGTEDDILGGMHKKTRYNIRLAGKKGVKVQDVPISELDRWYNIYQVTAERDSIAIHSKEYYLSVYNHALESEGVDMKLLFAEHDGDLLAGIFILICGDRATYLYGASSNVKRNLMPSYLLQWEAIKLSKSSEAVTYDFFGIPPTGDKGHSMHGLYRFKTGFGGDLIHRSGCFDYSLNPLSTLFGLLESLRNFYYKKLRKK